MGPGAMGHKGLIQMGPMGCYRGPWGSPDGGPWVPWAITMPPQAPMAPCDPSHGTHFAPIGLIGKSQRAPWPRSPSFERAPWGAIKCPWASPDGAHGSHGPPHCPPNPRKCCACHHWPHATHPKGPMRPIGKSPRTPWPPWASFERAPWVTRDASKSVPWGLHGGHGAHPMGPTGPGAMGHKGLIQMGPMWCCQGPMGLIRWGPWVPWAT